MFQPSTMFVAREIKQNPWFIFRCVSISRIQISIKAEDLEVALDPNVWPLRVKVREFIHYSRRPGASQRGGGGREGRVQQEQPHVGQGEGAPVQQGLGGTQFGRGHGQDSGVSRGSTPNFLAPNRYALPGQGVPGGPMASV